MNVIGVEANSCSTFDTPHLHKARKGGIYLASTKNKTIAMMATMTTKQTTMMAKALKKQQ
jgi:hypothetical protein